MQMPIKLTKPERLFCLYFAGGDSPKTAALKAGYAQTPEQAGLELLERGAIRRYIKKAAALHRRSAEAGLCRLAFGSHADGVRLALGKTTGLDIDELDLFCVSELKWGKDGALDVKFHDRQSALLALAELAPDGDDALKSFYKALERKPKKMGDTQDDT